MSKSGKVKIGLALGAGGARGICHLGVLKALKENGIEIYCVSGSSMGAVVGGFFAAGVTLEKMEKISRLARQRLMTDFNIDLRRGGPAGLFGAKRVMKLFTGILSELRIEECPIKYRATGVDIENGELVIFDKGVLKDIMRASMSIPAAFTPWEIEGRYYMDGGVLCRIPVESARDMGADVVIAVDALGPIRTMPPPKGLLGIIERFQDIANWQLSKDKVNTADILITPDMGDKSQFMFKDNDKAVEAGYKAAMEAMPEIKAYIRRDWRETRSADLACI